MTPVEAETLKTLTKNVVYISDLINQYIDAHIDADTLAFEDEECQDPESQTPLTLSVQAD